MAESTWDQCQEHIRIIDDLGHERVLVCNLKAHSAPGDTTEEHYDEGLGALWRYAEDYDY